MKKNIRFIRPLFSLLLSIVLVLSLMLPSTLFVDKAFAYDAIGQPDKTITYKNYRGYEDRTVNFNDVDDGKKEGRRDTSDPQNLAKFSVEQQIQDWAALACGIFSKTPTKLNDDDYIETMWTDSINKPNKWSVFNNEFEKDKYYGNVYSRLAGLNTVDEEDGDEIITGDGLRFGSSLAAARDDLFNKFGKINGRKFGAENFKENMPIKGLDDDTERNVVYSNVACLDDLSGPGKRTINGFGIAFYDFAVGLLAPDGKESEDGTYNAEYRNSNSPTFTTADATYSDEGTNESAVEQSITSQYESKHVETGTVTNGESNTMGVQAGFGVTINWGSAYKVKGPLKQDNPTTSVPGFSLNINGSFSGAWENSFSQSQSTSDEETKGMHPTTILPPHTHADTKTSITVGNADLNVNCPIAVTFKVAIYCATGNYYDDNAGCHYFDGYHQGTFCAKFGDRESTANDGRAHNDAHTDLYLRASDEINHKDDNTYDQTWGNLTTYSTGNQNKYCPKYIPWDRITSDDTVYSFHNNYVKKPKEALNNLMHNYPAVLDRANSVLSSEDRTVVFSDPIALYPIKHIQLQDPDKANLKTYVGGSIDLDNCKVRALDQGMIDYYGFNSDRDGDWRIVDAEGKEIKSDLAEIRKEPGTNKTKFYANKGGTVYLRYFLHDNLVSYYNHQISTNAGLENWNGISVEIIDNTGPDATPSSIKLESKDGTATINVNKHTDLNTLYNCKLYTDSGKEVTDTYYWDVQEASGLTVNRDTGDAIAAQPGTYHVRTFATAGFAGNKKIYSDWVELKADEPVSNEITAPQPEASANTVQKTEPTEDLLDLVMSAYEKVQTYKENNNGKSSQITTTTQGPNGETIKFTSKDVLQKFKDAGINADEFYAMVIAYHVGKQNGKIPEETVKNVETFVGSVFTKAEIQNIQTSAKQFAYEKGYSMSPQKKS